MAKPVTQITLGIDASVNGVQVPSNGAMPNPAGYFNFLWYDFSGFGGLGGSLDSGNYVVGCHVDSAVYGLALCYYVRNLGPGAADVGFRRPPSWFSGGGPGATVALGQVFR